MTSLLYLRSLLNFCKSCTVNTNIFVLTTIYYYMSLHTAVYVSSCYCPHTTKCAVVLLDVSSYYCRCVLILYYLSPHTTVYVSSCYYICVLVLLYMCPGTTMYVSSYCMCPRSTIYVSSYYCMCPHTSICVLMVLYMCPHTAIFLSSCFARARAHTHTHTHTHTHIRGRTSKDTGGPVNAGRLV